MLLRLRRRARHAEGADTHAPFAAMIGDSLGSVSADIKDRDAHRLKTASDHHVCRSGADHIRDEGSLTGGRLTEPGR
jgi:hypothetical protein